jgi:hypothetical protein
MNLRAVSFLVLLGALAAGCGTDDGSSGGDNRGNSATETNVFRCGKDDAGEPLECDGGVEDPSNFDEIDCERDEDCPDKLPVCNRQHLCSRPRN